MNHQSTAIVDVQIACDNADVPSPKYIEAWVCRALEAAASDLADGTELSVRVVDTIEVQRLNREFRQKDQVTNVLSFPAGEVAGLPSEVDPMLGDIVVCAAVVSDEAVQQGKAVADHWAHMLVHGTLHLLGYDHQDETQAAEMEGLETKILVESGLKGPYGEYL